MVTPSTQGRDEALVSFREQLTKSEYNLLSREEEVAIGIQMMAAKRRLERTASKCPITARIISLCAENIRAGRLKPSMVFATKPLLGFSSPDSVQRTAQLMHQLEAIECNFRSLMHIERELQKDFKIIHFRRIEPRIQGSIQKYRQRIHNLSQNLPLTDNIKESIQEELDQEISRVREIRVCLYESSQEFNITPMDFNHWWSTGQNTHHKDIAKWLNSKKNHTIRLELAEICGFLGSDPATFLRNDNIMKQAREEFRDCSHKLAKGNVRLAINIAKKIETKSHVQLDDRIQAGLIGLLKAAEKYDPKKYPNKFGTYASYWIKQSIQREVTNMKNLIRVPQHIAENTRRVNRAMIVLENRGENATIENIAVSAKLSISEVDHAMNCRKNPSSMDQSFSAIPGEEDQNLHGTESDPEDRSVEEIADIQLLRKKLQEYCSRMPGNLPEFAKKIYGIGAEDHVPETTLEELAKSWKMTRERIRQIDKKFHEHLKIPELRKFCYLFNI